MLDTQKDTEACIGTKKHNDTFQTLIACITDLLI